MKCEICEKEVNNESVWSINASVTGKGNEIKGHKTCLQNVDDKIVIPERMKLIGIV